MAWLENQAFYEDAYCPDIGNAAGRIANEKTAARWLGREPRELDVLGRVLKNGLTESGVLLKLNTYEARLLRQSQQLLGQFLALRKARTSNSFEGMNGADADEKISVLLTP